MDTSISNTPNDNHLEPALRAVIRSDPGLGETPRIVLGWITRFGTAIPTELLKCLAPKGNVHHAISVLLADNLAESSEDACAPVYDRATFPLNPHLTLAITDLFAAGFSVYTEFECSPKSNSSNYALFGSPSSGRWSQLVPIHIWSSEVVIRLTLHAAFNGLHAISVHQRGQDERTIVATSATFVICLDDGAEEAPATDHDVLDHIASCVERVTPLPDAITVLISQHPRTPNCSHFSCYRAAVSPDAPVKCGNFRKIAISRLLPRAPAPAVTQQPVSDLAPVPALAPATTTDIPAVAPAQEPLPTIAAAPLPTGIALAMLRLGGWGTPEWVARSMPGMTPSAAEKALRDMVAAGKATGPTGPDRYWLAPDPDAGVPPGACVPYRVSRRMAFKEYGPLEFALDAANAGWGARTPFECMSGMRAKAKKPSAKTGTVDDPTAADALVAPPGSDQWLAVITASLPPPKGMHDARTAAAFTKRVADVIKQRVSRLLTHLDSVYAIDTATAAPAAHMPVSGVLLLIRSDDLTDTHDGPFETAVDCARLGLRNLASERPKALANHCVYVVLDAGNGAYTAARLYVDDAARINDDAVDRVVGLDLRDWPPDPREAPAAAPRNAPAPNPEPIPPAHPVDSRRAGPARSVAEEVEWTRQQLYTVKQSLIAQRQEHAHA
ncbi:MAG TPA: hypothetical protein VF292_02735 [Rhodanobacteraceae bacterium]